MSKKVGGGSDGWRKANNEIQTIPSESMKLVQRLKEIVNFPKSEIYAMLKDCNMDPDEAVIRLLSQDPFQQVKSKKETKKEARGILGSRPRGTNNTYNRGARDGSDRYSGQGGSTYFSSTDMGNFQGKSTNKKKSGTQGYRASCSSASVVANHHQTQNSDSIAMENKLSSVSTSDRISSSQSTSGHQTAWFGAADQRSMADRLENIHLGENDPSEVCGVDHVKADSVQEDDSAVSSEFYNIPYQVQSHPVEHRKDEDNVSSRSANFQQLTIDSPDQEALHGEDRPAVVFPNHVLIHVEEGSELIFGSFRDFRSRPLANNIKETSDVAPDIEHSDARNSEFGGDELLGSTSDGNMIDTPASGNFDDSLKSRREVLEQENSEGAQDHQYTFAHSEPGYMYENANQQQMYTAYDASQSNAQNQTQNLSLLSNVMQGYAHSAPDTFLAQTSQNAREHEFQYSALSAAQSMQSRNSTNVSSLGGQSIYMAEALQASEIPAARPTQETILSANIATGPAQQFPMHPHSQPLLPLTHYAIMTSYPLMPQNYPDMPSALQQQLAAAMLPQYRTICTPGTLPQSAATPASAYGFGNSSNVGSTGNIPFNQQSTPTGTTVGYEDLGNRLLALQQQQQQQQALRGSGIAATQPTQETIPSAYIATGPALAQQFPMHPYSQPLLPLTHYANMTSYPLMSQNYPDMPSAFQQQLAAALLPGNLPQSAAAPASAYGFGNSSNVGSTGNIPFNQQSTPTGTTLRYEDVLNHLLALEQQQQQQQNENSGMWHHGHGSTTTSGVPANTYQNLQAQQPLRQLQQQSQQAAGGYHQSQQQQHFGSHPPGYPNFCQSLTEMSLAHQQQQQQLQNENSGMWHHSHGSTTTSDVPANTYHNLQAQQLLHQLQQSQQAPEGYGQSQQQQHYGSHSHGYPNFYQSQTEMSLEHQQQNPAGSQAGQQSNQTQHLWQNFLNR